MLHDVYEYRNSLYGYEYFLPTWLHNITLNIVIMMYDLIYLTPKLFI